MLGDLDKSQCTSYIDLIAALDSRFGTSNRMKMFRVSLRSRTRKPAETLPELAQAIRRLTRQAYPNAPVSLQELIAKDEFIEAMVDPELHWEGSSSQTSYPHGGVGCCCRSWVFFSTEKQRGSAMKTLQAVTSQNPGPADATLRQELHKRKTMVQCLVQQPRGTSDISPHSWQRTWTSPECWGCDDQGPVVQSTIKLILD